MQLVKERRTNEKNIKRKRRCTVLFPQTKSDETIRMVNAAVRLKMNRLWGTQLPEDATVDTTFANVRESQMNENVTPLETKPRQTAKG